MRLTPVRDVIAGHKHSFLRKNFSVDIKVGRLTRVQCIMIQIIQLNNNDYNNYNNKQNESSLLSRA